MDVTQQLAGTEDGRRTFTQVQGFLEHLLEESRVLLPASSLHQAAVGLGQEVQRLSNKENETPVGFGWSGSH